MKFEVTLTTNEKKEHLYYGCFNKDGEYYLYQDSMGFKNKTCYSKKRFHLLRNKDYSIEIVIDDEKSIMIIDASEGRLELPITVINYIVEDAELYLKYQLQDQIFIYQIRSLNGRN